METIKVNLHKLCEELRALEGTGLNPDNYAGFQCADVPKWLVLKILGRLFVIGGGAWKMWNSTDPFFTEMCEKIPKADMTEWREGDIIVEDKTPQNKWGHTAVVLEDMPAYDGDKMNRPEVAEQNGFKPTQGLKIRQLRSTAYLLGVYRLKSQYRSDVIPTLPNIHIPFNKEDLKNVPILTSHNPYSKFIEDQQKTYVVNNKAGAKAKVKAIASEKEHNPLDQKRTQTSLWATITGGGAIGIITYIKEVHNALEGLDYATFLPIAVPILCLIAFIFIWDMWLDGKKGLDKINKVIDVGENLIENDDLVDNLEVAFNAIEKKQITKEQA